MAPRVLYFDLGNVLLSFCHERMCDAMGEVVGIPGGRVREMLFGTEEAQCVYWQCERGELDIDGYYEYFCGQLGARPDRRRLELAACDIFSPIEETIELVEQLRSAGQRLAILSNTNQLQWEFITAGRYPWLRSFGGAGDPFGWAVLSFEARSMKPDRRIYDIAVDRAGVPAGEIFFVDDRADNVAGALEAGLDAVQFVGAQPLRDELRRRGIAGA